MDEHSLQEERTETPGHYGNQSPFSPHVSENDRCGLQEIKVIVKEEEEESVWPYKEKGESSTRGAKGLKMATSLSDDHIIRLTVSMEDNKEGEKTEQGEEKGKETGEEEMGEERGEEGICGLINSDGEEVGGRPTAQIVGETSILEVRGEEEEQGEEGGREEETGGGGEKTNLKKEEEELKVLPIHGGKRRRGRPPKVSPPEPGLNTGEDSRHTVRRRGRKRTLPLPVLPAGLVATPRARLTFRCSVCGREFSHAYKLERHALIHTGETPHRCSLCGRGFNQKGNLKTHQKVHSGEKLSVDCPGEREEHQEEKQGACPDSAPLGAPLAPRAVPPQEELCFCRQCGTQFSQRQQLEEHMHSHAREKPYSCPDCGKRFINESYVQIHQRIHTGEKPFRCPECDQTYYTASALRLHRMKHSDIRPFGCPVCEKRFRVQSYLAAHLLTHTRDRPHLCSVCGKSYARAEELKVHHRLHTGEKPYRCGDCGKSFIYRQGLRQHQRTHGGRRMGPTRQLGRPKLSHREEGRLLC